MTPQPSTFAAAFVFYALAALVIAGAVMVAFGRNVLHTALALLATLAGVAGLYFFVGADFVGATQLVVYVGGVLVLFLFAVLLTSRIGAARASDTGQAPATNPASGRTRALLVMVPLLVALVVVVVTTPWALTEAVATPTAQRLGDAFLREYLLPFELASLVLLVALVGAMVLARRAMKEHGS